MIFANILFAAMPHLPKPPFVTNLDSYAFMWKTFSCLPQFCVCFSIPFWAKNKISFSEILRNKGRRPSVYTTYVNEWNQFDNLTTTFCLFSANFCSEYFDWFFPLLRGNTSGIVGSPLEIISWILWGSPCLFGSFLIVRYNLVFFTQSL